VTSIFARVLPVIAFGLLAVGCGVHTRVAVRNAGDAPISVTVADSGGESLSFDQVAPGTTSEFQEAGFDGWGGVAVTSGGESWSVDLTAEQDNTITVTPGTGATVEAVYNEENEYW
jgi:hypothetical protein